MTAVNLQLGDCLELLPAMDDASVDMVLADLPFGSTSCVWDVPISLVPLWAQLRRVAKPNAAIVMFATQPFTTDLIVAARDIFRYDLVWLKTNPTGFLKAAKMPLRTHESVLIFYRTLPTFNPQYAKGDDRQRRMVAPRKPGSVYEKPFTTNKLNIGVAYPKSVITYKNHQADRKHQTQKPTDLLAYLIRTYTNPGDIVLDPAMGSGSTAVACIATGRRFVGYELDAGIYVTATQRVAVAQAQPPLIPEAYLPVKQGEQQQAAL